MQILEWYKANQQQCFVALDGPADWLTDWVLVKDTRLHRGALLKKNERKIVSSRIKDYKISERKNNQKISIVHKTASV